MLSMNLKTIQANIKGMDTRTSAIAAAALLCTVLPLELSHLIAGVIGAAGYLLIISLNPTVDRKASKASKELCPPPSANRRQPYRPPRQREAGCAATTVPRGAPGQVQHQEKKPEVWRPSVVPVVAPSFKRVGWEAEVEELLVQISATAEGDAMVKQIARAVKKAIWPILPEAEVVGFAGGSLKSGAAFGVAVPDVDIVISADPQALTGRLLGRWSRARGPAVNLDAKKLHKSAIRACTDRLVSVSDFRFRRSAFRSAEPKVTLIAPGSSGTFESGVPVNLFVNAVQPFYNAALLTECGQLDQRAKELILLVKRWAKDRGLGHEAKGHLSPLAWTLLVIYFLQVGAEEAQPVLPPVESFEVSSGLLKKRGGTKTKPAPRADDGACTTTAELFRRFVRFYATAFDWRNEAICARLGRRGAPDLTLPLHIIVKDDGSTAVGPSIENPFEDGSNLGDCMSASSLARLHEELARAYELASKEDASLTALLEPWAPPAEGEEKEEDDKEN